jgi:hypothetical protein
MKSIDSVILTADVAYDTVLRRWYGKGKAGRVTGIERGLCKAGIYFPKAFKRNSLRLERG